MLDRLKALFAADSPPQPPNEEDVKLAAATLMFELIRADGQVDDEEIEQMQRVLAQEFHLSKAYVDALIQQAQASAENAISLQGFTRQICDSWDNDQRVKLLEYLWILALADGHIDTHERHLVRKVAGLLYLTDRQINLAREAAKLASSINSTISSNNGD